MGAAASVLFAVAFVAVVGVTLARIRHAEVERRRLERAWRAARLGAPDPGGHVTIPATRPRLIDWSREHWSEVEPPVDEAGEGGQPDPREAEADRPAGHAPGASS